MKFFRQVCVLLVLAGLSACGGPDKGALKAEIEETRTSIGDELTALEAVKMERQSELDGLKDDVKWEYSEELETLVKQYESEFTRLKENMSELEEIEGSLGGYEEKLGGMPLQFSARLTEEMFREQAERADELIADNEAIEEKMSDLSGQIDKI
ncbi:hypothetical protein CHL67_06240 [Prosthecochloris sp. GSB1]|nr:hypothetical protein CHL67_06240 [Prosthecochloris sp. GSB1]